MHEGQRWAQEGETHFAAGRYRQAEEAFSQAEAWYAAHEQPLRAAEMRANRGVAALQRGDASTAYELLHDLPALFAAHHDLRRAGQAWGNVAAALEALGRVDEAQDAYRRAWQMLEQAGDHEAVAYVAQALSRLQLRARKPWAAVALMDQGLSRSPKPLHRWLHRLLRFLQRWMAR
ncbi:MAG: tetratricopeptide repeat protein [Chloroflexi bacterium]|nr:tetratricopeptide repeat protein [Chloroflexota bacterium]